MKRDSQHITFDDLFAFNDGRLDLYKANQCAKHLETCEECRNTLEAMQEFDSIELRQPHIEYEVQLLDQELLNITKQHIKESQRNSYIGKLKGHFYENKRDALMAAATILIILTISFLWPLSHTMDSMDTTVSPPMTMLPYEELSFKGMDFYFPTNSDQFTPSQQLVNWANRTKLYLIENPNKVLYITGYTDSDGESAYNMDLGMKRANTVRTFLINSGVKAKMRLSSKGETANTKENDKRQNRRVNVRIK